MQQGSGHFVPRKPKPRPVPLMRHIFAGTGSSCTLNLPAHALSARFHGQRGRLDQNAIFRRLLRFRDI